MDVLERIRLVDGTGDLTPDETSALVNDFHEMLARQQNGRTVTILSGPTVFRGLATNQLYGSVTLAKHDGYGATIIEYGLDPALGMWRTKHLIHLNSAELDTLKEALA